MNQSISNNKRSILFFGIFLGVLFLLMAGIGFLVFTPKQGFVREITLTQDGFSPAEISIKPGDSIKFTTTLNQPFWPASDLHPTHGIYPEFDPQEPIEPNNSWTFQFLKSGRWRFHDHLQPQFRGTIEVN